MSPLTRSAGQRHERLRGLPACLGAAFPGQRLAGCLGGGRPGKSGQAQAKGEREYIRLRVFMEERRKLAGPTIGPTEVFPV